LDLSPSAFKALGNMDDGILPVRRQVSFDTSSLKGSSWILNAPEFSLLVLSRLHGSLRENQITFASSSRIIYIIIGLVFTTMKPCRLLWMVAPDMQQKVFV
jgi:hypothetical protein